VTRSEFRWVLIASLLVLLLASLPTLYAWALADADHVFTGFVYNTEDGNSYIAKMRLGARGEWLFHLPYTTEPHPGSWLYTFHLLLGKLANRLGLSYQSTYHLARVVLGLGLLVTIYLFISRFVADVTTRRVAWTLAAIGSGLGWLLTLLGATHWLGDLPLDFWVPEAYVFLVLYSLPHLALAETALLWALLLLLDAFAQGSVRHAVLSGFCALVMTILVPFYPLVMAVILGIYLLLLAIWQRRIPWPEIGLVALMGTLPTTVVIYNVWLTSTEPVYQIWASQLRLLSPHPVHYLLGYTPLLVTAVYGLKTVFRPRQQVEDAARSWHAWLLPIAWLLAAPILAYLPFTAQRRLIVLVQVPLAMLAAVGLCAWAGTRRWTLVAYVAFSSLSILLLVVGSLGPITRREIPIYRPGAEVAALEWLAGHTQPDEGVLASFETGNVVPTRADVRAFAGHGPETLHSTEKQRWIEHFFQAGTDDVWRQSLLHDYGLDYVFYGPLERALGDWDLAEAQYLIPIHREEGYTIYRVALEESSP
jgi:hypothetical protein